MPGKRVFHIDPYQTELNTTVVSSRSDERGIWFSFQETLFYPQGGGQSSDKGWVASNEVLDVQSSGGDVWHLLGNSIPDQVSMKLDWEHRYSNMQQHTGQHILSACFKEFFNLDTISVHLGRNITMIELKTPSIENEILLKSEESANQMIRDNLPVQSIVADRNDLDNYKLRRSIKTNDEAVRLIQIGDIDCVGCGGTHVRSTAEVGLIKILGVEKIRGHARVKIKIGASAYQYFQELHHTFADISTKLTTSVEDLPQKIDLMVEEKKDLINEKKKVTDLWLAEYAQNLKNTEHTGCFALKDLDKDHLKIVSEHYLKINNSPCLFVSEVSGKSHFYIRLPENVNLNLQEFVQQAKDTFPIKGGGGKEFAVGQFDPNNQKSFSYEQFFHSFEKFINERSDD